MLRLQNHSIYIAIISVLCLVFTSSCRSKSETLPQTANSQQTAQAEVEVEQGEPSASLLVLLNAVDELIARESQSFGMEAAQYYIHTDEKRKSLIALMPKIVFAPDLASQFLLARAFAQNAEHAKAVSTLSRLIEEEAQADFLDLFYYYRAKSLQAQERWDEAIADYAKLENYRASPYYHEAKLEITQCLYEAERWPELQKEIDQFLTTYPEYPRANALRLQRAISYIAQAKEAQAAAELNTIIFDSPWAAEAQTALAILEKNGYQKTMQSFNAQLNRVDFLRRNRFWPESEIAILPLLESHPQSIALQWQNARIAYDQSRHAKAIPLLEKLKAQIANKRQDDLHPITVNAYLSQAYVYTQQRDEAKRVMDDLLQLLPKGQRNARLQRFYMESGQFDEAYALMMREKESAQKKQRKPKKKAETPIVLEFSETLLAYLAQKYDVAEEQFKRLQRDSASVLRPRMQYWYAQSLAKQEKFDAAKDVFAQIIEKAPLSYYAIMAQSRIWDLENGSHEISNNIDWQKFDEKTKSFDEIDTAYINVDKNLKSQFFTLINQYSDVFPSLKRVKFFYETGMQKELNKELRSSALEFFILENRYRRSKKLPPSTKPWNLELSMDGFHVDNRRQKNGVWGISLTTQRFKLPSAKDKRATAAAAQRQRSILQNAATLRPLFVAALIYNEDYYLARRYSPLPRSTPGTAEAQFAWSVHYPRAFNSELRAACDAQSLNPYLLWTVMNIESAFNPDSVSHANAFGLLQVIPITGYKLAKALEIHDFGPMDLLDISLSIRFGAWYLTRIIEKFHGNELLALAGYNGGPHQVARWIDSYGATLELDAFVELIPYNEARNYVKKGMERLLLFKKIYENDTKAAFYISNQLKNEYLEMPNY
ncbi:MAG: transglycosylase SLT domain-containing protein [Bradymonadia bacterium]